MTQVRGDRISWLLLCGGADGRLSSASNHEVNEDCAEADRKDRVQRLIDATLETVETA